MAGQPQMKEACQDLRNVDANRGRRPDSISKPCRATKKGRRDRRPLVRRIDVCVLSALDKQLRVRAFLGLATSGYNGTVLVVMRSAKHGFPKELTPVFVLVCAVYWGVLFS